MSDQLAGPNVIVPSLDEMMRAIEGISPTLEWSDVAELVIPVLPRERPYPPGMPTPLHAVIPPGVAVGFGIDMGPAFINVTQELLDGWPIGLTDLIAQALINLHERAGSVGPEAVFHAFIGHVPVQALQTGLFVGSVLVLAPGELTRLFGREPRLFVAPMRDLILGLPATVDRELAAWIFDEIASEDPNRLAPRAFLAEGGRLLLEALPPTLRRGFSSGTSTPIGGPGPA